MRRFFKSVFGASSKEVNGIIVLVVVFLMTMAYPAIHRFFSPGMQPVAAADRIRLDSLVAILAKPVTADIEVHEKFAFNPNTAGAETLARLGFTSRTISQIINYRNNGGQFRIKNDLLKIYSIDSTLVMGLYNYIDLPADYARQPRNQVVTEKKVQRKEPVRPKEVTIESFELNTADTAILQTVKGVGSVLSKRIVSFRDKLGGFASIDQLYEVYNLDSLVIEQLLQVAYLSDSSQVRKLPVNSAREDELASHPYISRKQARLIVAYRNQHGDYQSANDLLSVYLVDETDLKRLQPYLIFE